MKLAAAIRASVEMLLAAGTLAAAEPAVTVEFHDPASYTERPCT